jgi:transcriptional regulator with XRE-family HTH domain
MILYVCRGYFQVTSFQFDIGGRARVAGRFIGHVRNELLRVLAEQKAKTGLTQQALASKLDVHRSLINRQLSGEANMTLRSLADLAWAMGMEISFELKKPTIEVGQNNIIATSTVGPGQMNLIDGGSRRTTSPIVPGGVLADALEATKSA